MRPGHWIFTIPLRLRSLCIFPGTTPPNSCARPLSGMQKRTPRLLLSGSGRHHRSPLKHPLALGAAASWLQGAPGKWARKAENLAISYLNSVSLIAFVGANPEQRQGRSNEWGSKVDWHRVCVMWNRASRHFAGR